MTEELDHVGGEVEPLVQAVERLEQAEADLSRARQEETRAEHKIEEAVEDIEHAERRRHSYELIVNRKPYTWPSEEISGSQIKTLVGSPPDWVVNQIIEGPGEDPEVGNDQLVRLALDAEPKGVKRFTTRKPKTSPGSK